MFKFKFRVLLISVFFTSLSVSQVLAIGIGDTLNLSPFWNYKSIETEHFRLTFPAELADVAQRSAQYLEDAHRVLSKTLLWEAHYKAPILLIDNADAANGLTTPVGRFGIALYVTPPDDFFSTVYYDDWLRLLCLHEYSHFLNMDATRSFWTPLRYIFGDVLLPNSVWPSWMLEGLAVYMETRYTHSGRGRSSYYEAILRSAVEAGVLDTDSFVTLDRINGYNPYFPQGETAYLFGYELMNQVERTLPHALGEMSNRSSEHFPFFINSNLENITGRDWYSYWASFVSETRERAGLQLKQIRSEPVTKTTKLTERQIQTLGTEISPDGKWLAYSANTLDERSGLYLMNLQTDESVRIIDKSEGSSLSFTPDSKHLFMSSLRRSSKYYLYSDIGVYSLNDRSTEWITHGLRARDPSVSRDGLWITFTLTENHTTSLARAKLGFKEGRFHLGTVEKLFLGNSFDHVGNPKYSSTGDSIYFSFHQNGKFSEDILRFNIKSKKAETLVSNGHFNHYPTVDSHGVLFYISDASGTDNLYQYIPGQAPKLVSNVTTGLAFPAVGPDDTIYAAQLSYTGYDLAKFKKSERPIFTHAISFSEPLYPRPDADSETKISSANYPVSDYSIFPSIWPRQWSPLILLSPGEAYIGGEVLGFDTTDRHQYLLAAATDTLVGKLDYLAVYSNRQLGPTLTLSASNQTSNVNILSNGQLSNYQREFNVGINLAYAFQWTYSSLTPNIDFNLDRKFWYSPGANPTDDDIVARGSYTPNTDLFFVYNDSETSPLAVAVEKGRKAILGERIYFNSGTQSFKTFLSDSEHFQLPLHFVANPSVRGSYSSLSPDFLGGLNSNTVVQGRFPYLTGGLPGSSFDRLPIRGYSGRTFYVRSAAIPAFDTQFPIKYLFRGWGTNPLFFNYLSGFAFAEAALFPGGEPGGFMLPSVGGGVRATLEALVQIPVTLTVEFNNGFRSDLGGSSELFLQLGVTSFQF